MTFCCPALLRKKVKRMANPWKKKVFAFNLARAADKESAEDLHTLLSALPPGQKKQLLKNATCAAILNKYGITADE